MPEGGTLTLRTKAVGGAADPSRQVHVEVSDTGTGYGRGNTPPLPRAVLHHQGRARHRSRAGQWSMAWRAGMAPRLKSRGVVGCGYDRSYELYGSGRYDGAADESRVRRAVPTALRILVVDDDPVLLRSLRDALEGDGHKIVTANGGQEGIDLFRARAQRPATVRRVPDGSRHAPHRWTPSRQLREDGLARHAGDHDHGTGASAS